jgi:hypothetical protein
MVMRLELGALLRRLLKEEGGVVLILYALLIPVIIGMIGLAIDGGRVFIVNSELQDLADAAALAGAAELDGTAAGMTAATDKALNLLNNDPRWSNVLVEGSQVQQPIRFCKSPLVSQDAWSACDPTTDPTEADFIEIVTIRRDVSPIFMVALGATSNVGSRAIAIAGTSTVACNVQPLMLCNPKEPAEFSASPGQMFVFKQMGNGQGNSPLYAPGDFGLLDPPGQDSSTGPQLRNLLSQQSPKFCYVNEVSPRPGQASGNVDTGINVRFDLQPSGNGQLAGLDLTPAPDVIKGFAPKNANNSCGPQNDLGSVARLPRDTTFNNVGTTQIGTQGPSAANLNAYWQYHHGSNWPVDPTTGAPLTRYQAYVKEIGMIQDGTWPAGSLPESPVPVCAPANLLNKGTAERRILDVVIVDCQSQGVQGNATTNVRSDKYAEFFVTEPSSNGTIYTEFVRMLTVDDDDSKLHKIVQLYR